jgi:hypothetical protein
MLLQRQITKYMAWRKTRLLVHVQGQPVRITIFFYLIHATEADHKIYGLEEDKTPRPRSMSACTFG